MKIRARSSGHILGVTPEQWAKMQMDETSQHYEVIERNTIWAQPVGNNSMRHAREFEIHHWNEMLKMGPSLNWKEVPNPNTIPTSPGKFQRKHQLEKPIQELNSILDEVFNEHDGYKTIRNKARNIVNRYAERDFNTSFINATTFRLHSDLRSDHDRFAVIRGAIKNAIHYFETWLASDATSIEEHIVEVQDERDQLALRSVTTPHQQTTTKLNGSITLKSYKRVTEVTLNNITTVNYLVGKNGSGKSSILNALSHLNDNKNSERFFRENSDVKFVVGAKSRELAWDSTSNKIVNVGQLKTKCFLLDKHLNEKGDIGIESVKFEYDKIDRESLQFLNDTSELINLPRTNAKRVILNDDPWSDDSGKRVLFQDQMTNVHPEYMAEGFKSINNLRHLLFSIQNQIELLIQELDVLIIILEEPENNLHPQYHKLVPDFIQNYVSTFAQGVQDKLCFFISTHSPFIISGAAKYETHKIFLLNDGSLMTTNQRKVAASSGYVGIQCAWAVGLMLGCEVTDLGYPINYIILEEHSLQIILEDARKKNLIGNYAFISASGTARLIGFSEAINQIEVYNTLIKCNPFYFDKYYVILDCTEDFSAKEKNKIEKIKNKIGLRFIELKQKSLEDYYKVFASDLYMEFNSQIEKRTKNEHGNIKAEFAHKIALRIDSEEALSKLFDGELDFLFKI